MQIGTIVSKSHLCMRMVTGLRRQGRGETGTAGHLYSYDPALKNNKNQRNEGKNPRQNIKGNLGTNKS